MLTSLTVRNFKPFGSRQTARLAPLTFVYGPNSAGKSSIIQSILLLKQSNGIRSAEHNQDSPLNPYGPPFNFGSVQALIHRQKAGQAFEIGLTYKANLYGGAEYHLGLISSDIDAEWVVESSVEMKFRSSLTEVATS